MLPEQQRVRTQARSRPGGRDRPAVFRESRRAPRLRLLRPPRRSSPSGRVRPAEGGWPYLRRKACAELPGSSPVYIANDYHLQEPSFLAIRLRHVAFKAVSVMSRASLRAFAAGVMLRSPASGPCASGPARLLQTAGGFRDRRQGGRDAAGIGRHLECPPSPRGAWPRGSAGGRTSFSPP